VGADDHPRSRSVTREEAERLLTLSREAKLLGPEAERWVERLAPEREKLVEAAQFLAESGQEEAAAELAANVWRVWQRLGDLAGGRRLVAAALDTGQGRTSRARALALYGGGALAFREGAMVESRERNEAALEAARAVVDREAEALALVGLSRVAFREGDYGRVCALAAEARQLTRDLGEEAGAAPLHMLAAGTRLAGDYDEAVDLYTESLELSRRLGDSRGVGMELHNIGHIEIHRGNVDAAERCFAQCAEVRNQADPYEAAMAHLNHAALAFARGERERAGELLRRTQSTLDDAGIVLDPDDAFEVEWLEEQLSASSGHEP
jgi:tetratricopeptide (TPR) repeat protein